MTPSSSLADARFVLAFEDCSLPREMFRHRNHLRLAWLYLQESTGEAESRMERSIRRYAGHHGASGKYHHTMTLFWVRAVAAARAATPGVKAFDAFMGAHPELLDQRLIGQFYSAARLDSLEARSSWVAPDLNPLP